MYVTQAFSYHIFSQRVFVVMSFLVAEGAKQSVSLHP